MTEIKDKDLEKASGGGFLKDMKKNAERNFTAEDCADYLSTDETKQPSCNICARLLDGSCADHP